MAYTQFKDGGGMYRRAHVSDETYFDGNKFSDYNVVVESISDPLPDMRENLVENVGFHGSSVKSLLLGTRTITLECRAFMEQWDGFEDIKTSLGSFLYTPDDRRLVLRNHPDQYYMAHYQSMEETDRTEYDIGLTMTFVASDPIRYDASERVVVIGTNSVERFEIGGTDRPQMRIKVVSNSATSHAFLTFENLDKAKAWELYLSDIKGNESHAMVLYDCVNHVVKDVNSGNMCGVSINANWPVLEPGRWWVHSHDGVATLTWRQGYR